MRPDIKKRTWTGWGRGLLAKTYELLAILHKKGSFTRIIKELTDRQIPWESVKASLSFVVN